MKKQKTLGARLTAANTELNSALGVFEAVANRLDVATGVHQQLSEEAGAEIDRLTVIQAAADAQVARSARAAQRVRELVG